MDHEGLGNFFLIFTLLYYILGETGTRSGEASLIEVYPWKEERLELLQYRPWIAGVFIMFYSISNGIVTSFNEQTNAPNGAIGIRRVISIIYPILGCFSFFGVIAMKDAKQVSRKDEKAVNILTEYKDVLINPSTKYVRWMWALMLPGSVYGSFITNSFLYYVFWVIAIPPEDYILLVLASAPTGLIVSCCMTTIMGCFFAKKSKQGREKSLNPLNYALGFGIFDTLLGLTLWVVWMQPADRDMLRDGGKGSWLNLYLWGLITGFFSFPVEYWRRAAVTWAVDYDNQAREKSGNKRREAIIYALSSVIFGICNLLGNIIASSMILGEDPLCDTRLSAWEMPDKCTWTLFNCYVYPAIALLIWTTTLTYFYPLKGKKLEDLYKTQGHYQKAVHGTDAWNTVGGGAEYLANNNVQLVSGSAVTVVTAAPKFIDITIPEGAEPGMQLAQTLSNGKTITFTIPEDKKVGDVIQVPLE